SGDDTNSRPKDADGNTRNDQGEYYGPEADGSYATLSGAVKDLMTFGSGGTVVVQSAVPAEGSANVTKPLTVLGGGTVRKAVSGGLSVIGTTLTVNNIHFVVPEGGVGSSAIRVDGGGKVDIANCLFTERGVGAYGDGEAEIAIRDSKFVSASPNGLTGMGWRMTVDIRNTEFEDIPAPAKCVVVIPGSGVAETVIKDCTFTNSRIGIDDRHSSGECLYQNLVFKNMSWIGLNVEWEPWGGSITDAQTIINDCLFENVAFQGLHFHAVKNVRVTNVTARGCGSVGAWSQEDGAGIGGHAGNDDIIIEDCNSSDNVGNGFHFESEDRNLTLSNNVALNNGRDGMKFLMCQDVTIELANWISGNKSNGIHISQCEYWKIHNNTIGLNRERTVALGNGENGILLDSVHQGEIGSKSEFLLGNAISGNSNGAGIAIQGDIAGDITISRNFIGTDAEGMRAIPNENGILIKTGGSMQSGRLVIGGDNPSVSSRASGEMGFGNVISGNLFTGIRFDNAMGDYGTSFSYHVFGNYIGVDQTGLRPIGNHYSGILILGTGYQEVLIGTRATEGKGNVISGNGSDGIRISSSADHVSMHHNLIGTGVDGETKIANTLSGIYLFSGARENLAEENVIWFNEQYGIGVQGETTIKNKFTQNSIHRNLKGAIRLLDGANGDIKTPKLDRLFMPGRSITSMTGEIEVPNGTVEIFVDPATTEPGYWGQGKTYIREMTLDAEGKFVIDLSSITRNGIVTATVTDSEDNTSEFSPFLTGVVVQTVGHKGDRLVAGKNTAVRIFGDTGNGTTKIQTEGELTIGEGAVVVPEDSFEIAPFGYYDADARKGDRKQAKNSLNFLIPNPSEGEQEIKMKLTANGHDRAEFDVGKFNFRTMKQFRVGLVPIIGPLRAYVPGTATPDLSVVNDTGRYFADVYPLSRTEFLRTYRVLSTTQTYLRPHTDTRQRNLALRVQSILNSSRPRPDYAAGIVSYDTFLKAPTEGGILYGYTYLDIPKVVVMLDRVGGGHPPQHNGSTLAHEIGHTAPFGLGDTYASGDPEPSINPIYADAAKKDRSGNYIQEEDYGFSPTGALGLYLFKRPGPVFSEIRPATPIVRDIMGSRDPAWIDTVTYNHLFDNLVVPAAAKTRPMQEETPLLDVQGLISRSDTAELFPLDHELGSDESEEPVSTDGIHYQIVLLDAGGAILDSRDLYMRFAVSMRGVSDTGEPFASYESTDSSPFSITLRDDPAGRRIELRKDDLILAFLEKSSSIPVVTSISADYPGGQPSSNYNLIWTASDADPGETEILSYDVLYTPDNGETIIPLAIDITGTNSMGVTTDMLPGSDEGRFIVRACDGWNQGELISDVLLSITDHEPSVKITRPSAQDELVAAERILFTGSAYDWEDGVLMDESVIWTLVEDSSILGYGLDTLVTLPVGQHTICLTVEDSSGNVISDEVTVTVVEKPSDGTTVRDWLLR
ncbi:MAG: right-handed parallel beta-helix repeat-containing protein, partial [bacterium]